jgi:hypothetical protein
VPSPDDLLADAPIAAAVTALAERNRHHLDQMTEAERNDALSHWHDLAVTVLSAAGAALGGEEEDGNGNGPGRAIIVLEDLGGEVLVTPAQAAALELLDAISGEDGDGLE